MNAEGKQQRVHSRQEWREIVWSGEESGKSRREFCEEQGLRYATYRRWVGIFEREKQGKKEQGHKFQELRFPVLGGMFSEGEQYELELGQARLRIPGNFREETLYRLLLVMGKA